MSSTNLYVGRRNPQAIPRPASFPKAGRSFLFLCATDGLRKDGVSGCPVQRASLPLRPCVEENIALSGQPRGSPPLIFRQCAPLICPKIHAIRCKYCENAAISGRSWTG